MNIPVLYAHYLKHRLICTDTRKITPGCIFFALKGDHFDGNHFAQDALNQGAALAVVSDDTLSGDKFFFTPDTLQALQALAHFHRKKLSAPVIAITGSNGKTTTKELITTVLSTTFKVSATVGNYNNHIGVPLTLLSISEEAEIIVCEMGANHAGEIKMLCDIAAPTHGIITNIGKAHLEGFGSLEGVKKAKGELFDYLAEHQGYGFVNLDDERVEELGKKLSHKTTFSLHPLHHADIHLIYSNAQSEEGFILKNETESIVINARLFGRYNASNMLAAYTIGLHFGVDHKHLIKALAGFVSKSNRSEEVNYKGCKFIMDAYNANPSSMEPAIRAFAEKHPHGWVILGDMKELGQVSREAHRQIVSLVVEMNFERIYFVGEDFSSAFHSMHENDSRVTIYNTMESLKKEWVWEACQDKAIFVKGSRSMQLESLLK